MFWFPRLRCLAVFMTFALVLFMGLPAVSQPAGKRLAVLEFKGAKIANDVLETFADTVRGGVLTGLAGSGVQVMTRENMVVLLKQMGKQDCDEGDCEVETARNIGADYVISGSVVRVDNSYVVTLKLHETKGGNLVAVDQATAQNQIEVLRQLRESGRRIAVGNIGAKPVASVLKPASLTSPESTAPSKTETGHPVPSATAPLTMLIATVDKSQVIKMMPEGQAAMATLRVSYNEKQKSLDGMQADVKARIDAFNRNKSTLSPAAVAKGEASLQQEVAGVMNIYKTYQKELTDNQAAIVKKVADETVLPRIRTLARALGSPTVIDTQAAPFFHREIDLTDKVTSRATSASLIPVRTAQVDLKKILRSVREGVRARAVLASDFKKKQVELDRIQDEIKQTKARFDSQSRTMSPEERLKSERQMRERVDAVQKLFQSYQKDLTKSEETATSPIIVNMKKVIAKLANDRGLGLAYDTSVIANSVLVGESPESLNLRTFDMTDEVIAAYNAQFP